MLCPEVWKFPPPKTICSLSQNETLESVIKTINMNSFYQSVIITCPDTLQTPSNIEEVVTEDSDFYKITNCSLTELIEPDFIEKFVKNGSLYCISADRNCVIENSAAVTPDGFLVLHILEYIYQTLGFAGIKTTKRPHNYYQVEIDLKNVKHRENVYQALTKLELFDFYVIWEPHEEDICPSSIAKYFSDRNITISLKSINLKKLAPTVTEIPCVKDVEIDELVEWVGMLGHGGNLNQAETYISTYSQPDSTNPIASNKISLLIAKGYFSPFVISSICNKLAEYVRSRQLDNYWASLSVQSFNNSLWQWNTNTPKVFQLHDSSHNVFFTHEDQIVYAVGQIKFS